MLIREGMTVSTHDCGEMRLRAISTIMLTLLFIGLLTLAFNIQPAKASGIINIRANGSIDPPTANITSVDNVTYTLTDNIYDEIVVERSNIIIDGAGYTVQGTGIYVSRGIYLYSITNITIINTNIKGFGDAIYLSESSYSNISGNNITANEHGTGVGLDLSSNNSVSGNNIANNFFGIWLESSSNNNVISGNNIANNSYGICIDRNSNFNIISGNNVKANERAIELTGPSYNSIFGNDITGNAYGVYLYKVFNKKIYHNNFIGNGRQVYDKSWENPNFPASLNTWDDGYPSGGNYWDDYGELDTDGDGIGDTPYVIDANNTDRYPLVVPLGSIPIVWDGIIYPVELESNSTISRFQFKASQKMISFNVTGVDGTLGFCNLTIPNSLVQDLWQGNFTVLVDGKETITMNNWTDGTYTYIYFTYLHPEHKVEIIPEFPSFLIIPLFMIATLLAVIIYRRKHSMEC